MTGFTFRFGWLDKTLAERFELVRDTMPSGNPAAVDEQAKIDAIAFILAFNGYPAGEQELGTATERLEQIVVTAAP